MKLNVSCSAKIFPLVVDVELSASVDSRQETTSDGVVADPVVQKISTFGALKQHICSLCNINPTAIKIVHKGRILTGSDSTPLSSFNFKENDKLLVLGKPPATQTDAGWKLLVDFERKYTKNVSKLYEKNADDLTQLEKNYLKDPERREYTQGIDKRLKGFTENCIKLLEKLDGLQIISDTTEKEQAQRNREKRKYLVDALQDALNKNDKLIARLSDYLYKCEHPEEGL